MGSLESFSWKKFAGFAASFVFALLLALMLIMAAGSQPAGAATAAYSAYSITGTGGDCAVPGNGWGAWDAYTSTCTLQADIAVYGANGININSGNVTLNGNGHLLSGNNAANTNGVYLSGMNGVTIKNLTVEHFYHGIELASSGSNTLTGDNASSNNSSGIYLTGSSNNILSDNTANSNSGGSNSGNAAGIELESGSNGNTLSGNTANNTNGGNWMTSMYVAGIWIGSSGSNSLTNNTVINNQGSNLSWFDVAGIYLNSSSNNILSGNTASIPGYNGFGESIGLWLTSSANGNTLFGNTSSSNQFGIYLNSCSNNQVYHNSFLNNSTVPARVYGGSGNLFNLPAPTGGNYWSNWSTPDANSDGFVDSPYVFTGGQDNLPLTSPPASGKPPLTLDLPSPSWASLSDYQAGVLSVTWMVNNTGAAEAWSVQLTGSSNTNGVTASTALPVYIGSGDILPGASGSVTLKYSVPAGVSAWISTLAGSAEDGLGTGYSYP